LQEFRTHTGEVLNPYKVLNVPRTATTAEIRESYVKQSRRYHPDAVRQKDILPGSCNNLDDVREEWERIKLSYEILKNERTRKRYDRHEFLADPGEAARRAAMGAVGKGLAGMGKGIFNMGATAVKHLSKKNGVVEK
jgi:molecular chaperone DnaJ